MKYKNKKAGILLYERTQDGRILVLAPYCDNRYGEGIRGYNLAKGKVDDDEKGKGLKQQLFNAAMREFHEETGISISELKKGRYKGVKLLTELPCKPFHESVHSSHRHQPNHLTMYAIEVQGIQNLAPHCKQHQPAMERRIPDSGVLLDILRKGLLPPDLVAAGGSRILFKKPLLNDYLHLLNERRKELWQRNPTGPEPKPLTEIRTLDDLYEIHRSFAGEAVLDPLIEQVEKIRGQLEALSLVKDSRGPKIDSKIRWLCEYREGAEVKDFADYIEDISRLAEQDEMYRHIMFGRGYRDNDTGQIKEGESKVDTLLQMVHKLQEKQKAKRDRQQPNGKLAFLSNDELQTALGYADKHHALLTRIEALDRQTNRLLAA